MPDTRRHRGRHPTDARLFAPERLAELRAATAELSWLLGRGYAMPSALQLVGNRHGLRERQRLAVQRCAAADADRDARRTRQIAPAALAGRDLQVDGFNCLITVEAALAGGLVLVGRDGAHRDLASVHGGWRRVEETEAALAALGAVIAAATPASVTWLLDKPISNSGRLAGIIRERAAQSGWTWQVELHHSPDRVLAGAAAVAATGDSAVLDRCGAWIDLPGEVIRGLAAPWVIDLAAG
jgi:hypothetical protein